MTKELDYLDKILNYQPLTLVERTIIECIKEKIQRLEQIDNANPSEVLEKLKTIKIKCHPNSNPSPLVDESLVIVEQALLKAQEQEKENARLKEILINGFKDKNGVFHKQTYLAFIDNEWCICDLKTDEWFLVREVL